MTKLIAIDIGHGSDTYKRTGGKGVVHNGKVYEEHTFNSATAIELDKVLKYNGFKTVMYQQPYSKEIGLTQRTNYYNKIKVDLVWSIHANAGSHKANGACSFYWHTSEDGKKLAYLFAEEMNKAGYNTHGNGIHASERGSWTNMHICRETNMVAMLTENGFMTNPEEFKEIFLDPNYSKAMARVHAKAICRYYGVMFKDTKPIPTPQPKTEIKKQGGNRMLNLQDWQWEVISDVLRDQHKDGILNSPDWEVRARNKELSVDESILLIYATLGRNLDRLKGK